MNLKLQFSHFPLYFMYAQTVFWEKTELKWELSTSDFSFSSVIILPSPLVAEPLFFSLSFAMYVPEECFQLLLASLDDLCSFSSFYLPNAIPAFLWYYSETFLCSLAFLPLPIHVLLLFSALTCVAPNSTHFSQNLNIQYITICSSTNETIVHLGYKSI